ncbi:magnesium-translocating P-type ATPase [Aureimonas sp. AU4]|uniref:magnesium-translocating P-type ATPase n=1 Tax=Aureimonas sp. AU4 TaxID=1638163 RepID=UPI0012E3F60A|nr:magnesium-translocating P-type ATPase [Aureimonas sp. AU4]
MQDGLASGAVRPPDTEPQEGGLAPDEAARRLARYGPNALAPSSRTRWWHSLGERLRNPLVLVLLAAAGVSAATGERGSFLLIGAVVAMSLAIDTIQESRANRAADDLEARVALKVQVLRDGRETELPPAALVPGDVLRLSAGSLVPADARLLEATHLFVNEALLTGEAFPVEKSAGAKDAGDAALVFMGSSVVSGTARCLVVATGPRTRLGAIAGALAREPPPTAFTLGLRRFGMLIVRLTILLVLSVLFANLLFGRPLVESFLFALALTVGLTPELLPMVVTVTLAHGAMRLSAREVIVKRLSAIHDLGSMDVLCSDKTGTLTEARIALVDEVDIAGASSGAVLDWARVNAAFETGLKSPLDEAILAASPSGPEGWRKIDEVPFDFERRRISVLAEREGRRCLVVKGAPDDVLALSSRHLRAGASQPEPLDAAARALAKATFEAIGSKGCRALGVAWREVEPDRSHADLADERDLVFAGFAVFLDPPKASAREAVASLAALGVALKIVTGDDERVTRHVCETLGLPVAGVATGPELDALTDEALMMRVDAVNVFCRINPTQKARIVRALRRRGHVVGYLGDGINDAPSLQAADAGLSVDGAVDVAKEAASLILLRNDLGVLAEAVREGRWAFSNIMKYVMMGTSSNFGNMFSMAGGVLFLPFLPMLPVQILLNNLLYDVSEIPIPLDRVDREDVARPHGWDMGFVRDFMLTLGSVSSVFDALTFALLLLVFHAGEATFQTAWFMESMATQVLVVFVIRTRGSPLASRPSPALAVTALVVVATALFLPFTPLGPPFGFHAPPLAVLPALGLMTALYL